jgi:cytochrome c oxidase cbb3-type subunit 1
MTITIGALLALSFLISVLGLFLFIWAQMNNLMHAGPDASDGTFAKGEVGLVEGPSLAHAAQADLQRVENKSSGQTVEVAAQRATVAADNTTRLAQHNSQHIPRGRLAAVRWDRAEGNQMT